jgi:NAD(P)-dependent dehydrogenase (short-subunit alcohol dehydrogenase family)
LREFKNKKFVLFKRPEQAKETHALGRHGYDFEVAKTVAFLASDDASFITAELVHVDGGKHAMCSR